MEISKEQRIVRDIHRFHENGIQGFLFDDQEMPMQDGSERLRDAYEASWSKVYGSVFAANADWRFSDDPTIKLHLIFSEMTSFLDKPELTEYANFAYVGRFEKGQKSVFDEVLFEGQAFDRYKDEHVINELTEILSAIDSARPAPERALGILNLAAGHYLNSLLIPGAELSEADAHEALERLLRGDYAAPDLR